MSHYSPSAGLTKPLNQMENPIYPDIKRGPPRFVWSRKHWNVDTGATLRELEPYSKFFDGAVLAQSRNYNKTVYGQSSFKSIVNAEFRPPLIAPYEISRAANRMPCTTHAIIPHINPSGGGFRAKNEMITGVEAALTDRVVSGEIRPTFYAPMSMPQDNSILPDLELKLPSVSVSAGWKMPGNILSPETQSEWADGKAVLDQSKYNAPLESGYTTALRIDGPTGMELTELDYGIPQVSASAGYSTPITFDGENAYETLVLDENRPSVSASAGYSTPITFDGENAYETLVLDENRPSVSASAGYSTPITFDGENAMEHLQLSKKQGDAYLGVINPNGGGYTPGVAETEIDTTEYIQDNRPAVSYSVTPTTGYRSRNGLTHRPRVRQKLQPLKSYGQISQSGATMPMRHIMRPQLSGLISQYDKENAAKRGYRL